MAPSSPTLPCHARRGSVRLAVAIPARDEADRIVGCLTAVERALRGAGPARIVVLADRCRDGTAELARIWDAMRLSGGVALEVVEDDAGRHAGTARARAVALARRGLDAGGVIATTDADSRPAPGWGAALCEVLRGADVACGPVRLARAPAGPAARIARVEGEALRLQAEVAALIDPDSGNPWPHHLSVSGASLALTAAAHDALGGLPTPPVAEDRALVQAALDRDMRVRRADVPEVVTSARTDGRAAGGLAATLAERGAAGDPLCDERLLPLPFLMAHATIRRRLREGGSGPWLAAHGVDPAAVPAGAGPGAAWAAIRGAAPHLSPGRLRLGEVERQLPTLRRLVARLTLPAGLTG
jgi:hypothetical protein